MFKRFMLCTVLLASLTAAASAAPVTILNSSFDQLYSDAALTAPVTLVDGKWYAYTRSDNTNVIDRAAAGVGTLPMYIEGWYASTNSQIYSGLISTPIGTAMFNTGEGDNACLGMQFYNPGRTATQTLSATLEADTDYTLSVEVGRRKDYPWFDADDVVVQLLAGGTVLTVSTSVTSEPAAGDFDTWTFTFDADDIAANVGQTLGIRLGTITTETQNTAWAFFDNVALNATPVPEPATMAMLGLGGVMMLVRRRRKIA